jgi:hypothetical protein
MQQFTGRIGENEAYALGLGLQTVSTAQQVSKRSLVIGILHGGGGQRAQVDRLEEHAFRLEQFLVGVAEFVEKHFSPRPQQMENTGT